MKKLSLSCLLLMSFVTACYSNDPTAVQYKNSQAAGVSQDATPSEAEPPAESDNGADGADGEAALLAQGEEAYTSKGCGGCHNGTTAFAFDGETAGAILDAVDVGSHAAIEWPTEEEAAALEAYIQTL